MKKRRISVYLCDYNIMVGVVPNAILQFSGPQIRQLKRALKQCWGQYIIPTAFSIVSFLFAFFPSVPGRCVNMFIGFCLLLFLFNLLFWIPYVYSAYIRKTKKRIFNECRKMDEMQPKNVLRTNSSSQ